MMIRYTVVVLCVAKFGFGWMLKLQLSHSPLGSECHICNSSRCRSRERFDVEPVKLRLFLQKAHKKRRRSNNILNTRVSWCIFCLIIYLIDFVCICVCFCLSRCRQGRWYVGRPTVYKPATKEHRVEYDDGDVRDHVLAHRSWGMIG